MSDDKLKAAARKVAFERYGLAEKCRRQRAYCITDFLAGAAYEREQQAKRVCGECKYYYVPDTYSGLICNKGVDFPGDDLVDDSDFGCKLFEPKEQT